MKDVYVPVYEDVCCSVNCCRCPESFRSAICWFEVPVSDGGDEE